MEILKFIVKMRGKKYKELFTSTTLALTFTETFSGMSHTSSVSKNFI